MHNHVLVPIVGADYLVSNALRRMTTGAFGI